LPQKFETIKTSDDLANPDFTWSDIDIFLNPGGWAKFFDMCAVRSSDLL